MSNKYLRETVLEQIKSQLEALEKELEKEIKVKQSKIQEYTKWLIKNGQKEILRHTKELQKPDADINVLMYNFSLDKIYNRANVHLNTFFNTTIVSTLKVRISNLLRLKTQIAMLPDKSMCTLRPEELDIITQGI